MCFLDVSYLYPQPHILARQHIGAHDVLVVTLVYRVGGTV